MDISKREEIREGLEKIEIFPHELHHYRDGHTHLTPQGRDKFLSYLHKEGVVFDTGKTVLMGDTEYTLTEPLIEE